MTKRYEKFEEWMIGKTVRDDEGDKGVVTRELDSDDHYVWVEWEGVGEAWAEVDSLMFLNAEVKDKSEQENKPISWQVGQVVWDVVYGKGVVDEITGSLKYPIVARFSDETMAYTTDGRTFETHGRTLFFSEPKIEAELFPPKKPFAPKLKEGDKVLIKDKQGLFGEGTVRVVHKECDDRIYISDDWHYFMKSDIASLQVISEEIKFEGN